MAPRTRSKAIGSRSDVPPPEESLRQTRASLFPESSENPLSQFQIGILEVLRELLQNQQRQTECLQQSSVSHAAVPNAPRPDRAYRNFREMQPEKFKGTEGGLYAEEWLAAMACLLKNAGVAPEAQVEAMKIQLSDIAKTWWQVEELSLEKPVPWEVFETRFLDRFFPRSERLELEQQFIALKQRDSSVEEYTVEFTRLSRFAPDLVRDPESKARRYEQGLNTDIQVSLSVMEFASFEAVYRAALRYEKKCKEREKEKTLELSRVAAEGSSQPKLFELSGLKETVSSAGKSHSTVVCHYCKRSGHMKGECRKLLGLCVLCGSAEHQRAACPRLRDPPPASGSGLASHHPAPSQSRRSKRKSKA